MPPRPERPSDADYYERDRVELFSQGDLFRDVPLAYPLPADELVVDEESGGGRRFLSGPLEFGPAMLITPSCSLSAQRAADYSHPVRTLVPVLPLEQLVARAGYAVRAATFRQRRRELFLATTKVEEFDRWWNIFSTTSLEKRKQHGSKGSHTFRDPNEEGRVWVLFDWDAEGWQNFVSDPEVPAILQEAGHASRPQVAEFAGQF